jgi:hypothetical protein
VKAQYVRPDGTEGNLWWKVAKDINLEERFKALATGKQWSNLTGAMTPPEVQAMTFNPEDVVIYGEVYGNVQDLKYGVTSGAQLRVFDTYSPSLGRYNDWDVTREIVVNRMGLDIVPELYVGPWKPELEELRNGKSVLYPGNVREGYVVKPVKERYVQYTPGQRHAFTGRVCFKFVGEDYKTRKRK